MIRLISFFLKVVLLWTIWINYWLAKSNIGAPLKMRRKGGLHLRTAVTSSSSIPSSTTTTTTTTPSSLAIRLRPGNATGGFGEGNPRPLASPPPCLVFLHIPKTGGRSIGTFLDQIARRMGFREVPLYEPDPRPASSLEANGSFTIGHFTMALFHKNPSMQDCHVVTVLREPVDRAISAFFYHGHKYPKEIESCLASSTKSETNNGTNNAGSETLARRMLRLETRGCWLKWQYSNDLTRYFAGLPATRWLTSLEDDYDSVPPDRTWLDAAKTNLEARIDAVCFISDLPSCAREVLAAFGLEDDLGFVEKTLALVEGKTRTNNPFRTRSRPRESLDEASMELFRKANALDTELYDWAVERFWNRNTKLDGTELG